jgi:hypothetical protein
MCDRPLPLAFLAKRYDNLEKAHEPEVNKNRIMNALGPFVSAVLYCYPKQGYLIFN